MDITNLRYHVERILVRERHEHAEEQNLGIRLLDIDVLIKEARYLKHIPPYLLNVSIGDNSERHARWLEADAELCNLTLVLGLTQYVFYKAIATKLRSIKALRIIDNAEWPVISLFPPCVERLFASIRVLEYLPRTLRTLILHGEQVGPQLRFSSAPALRRLSLLRLQGISAAQLDLPEGLEDFAINQSNLDLTKIKFPKSLRELRLELCGLTTLRGIQFPGGLRQLILTLNRFDGRIELAILGACCPGLRSLSMRHCDLSEIEDSDFAQHLPKLQFLDLSYNVLRSMRGVKLPAKLTELKLNWCELRNLEGIFFPTTRLKIHIHGNSIDEAVEIGAPPESKVELIS